MSQLYPPIIEGTLPAFYSDGKGATIVVPFAMNKAVSSTDIRADAENEAEKGGFALKLKTVQSNTFLLSLATKDYSLTKGEAYFHLNEEQVKVLKIGQFYKVQIAYGKGVITSSKGGKTTAFEEVGHYSTVGVIKFTAKPEVVIDGLEANNAINSHNYYYVGRFTASKQDITERVYSYNFKVWDNNNQLIASTGEIVHNSDNDVSPSESLDEFNLPQDLTINHSYYIQYTITTLNKMVVSTPRYRLMQKNSIDPEMKAQLIATLNYDNGYIELSLKGAVDPDTDLEIAETGTFLICRASDKENYNTWNEVLRFTLQGRVPSAWSWKDRTIEQGVSYLYSIQQYNENNIYSNRIYSNEVYGDYEDSFLVDGERQLKIRFNPKVSSFKKTVLETKVDTLGGKHPFIFRNGNIEYREFPISGLISYQMDEKSMFISKDKLYDIKTTTNLTSENLAAERIFKMEVLEWLTNGQPKLFRSPGEGCFIVRLMNSSLAPNDQVGRMLHTFTATAYEIADFTFDNLSSYGFLSTSDPTNIARHWKTITFKDFDNDGRYYYKQIDESICTDIIIKNDDGTESKEKLLPEDNYFYKNNKGKYLPYDSTFYTNEYPIYIRVEGWQKINTDPVLTAHFTDMLPGDQIRINGQIIVIGVTGGYYLDLGYEIENVEISTGCYQGSVTYSYDSIQRNVFDTVKDIDIIDVPAEQYFGAWDILDTIQDVKVGLQNLYQLHSMVRPVIDIYWADNGNYAKFYYDPGRKNRLVEFNLLTVYRINAPGKRVNGYYFAPRKESDTALKFHIDGDVSQGWPLYKEKDFNYHLYLNGNIIDLKDIKEYNLSDVEFLTSISQGPGLMTEISYQKSITTYSIETIDPIINNAYVTYRGYQESIESYQYSLQTEKLDDIITDTDNSIVSFCTERQKQISAKIPDRDNAYMVFIELLERGLEEVKRAKSIT